MRIPCSICGKKFKGTHGVAVHTLKMHHVSSISGAALPEKKPVRVRRQVPILDVIQRLRTELGTVQSTVNELVEVFGL